jgi:membrane protein YdbS with pleckstrin-like domain
MTAEAPRTPAPTLNNAARVLLGLHLLGALALALALAAVILTADRGPWDDLVLVVVLMMVGAWLLAVLISWAIARFAVRSAALRTAIGLLGPAVGLLAVPLIVRLG